MKRSIWFAMLAGLTVAIGVIVVWWSVSDRAQQHVQQMGDNAARLNQLLIRQDIGNRILALERLGQRWTAANGTPRRAAGGQLSCRKSGHRADG